MNRKFKNEELGRIPPEKFRKAKKIPIIIVLEDVRSAYNVGSIFRTADAFLIEAIYLCGFTPTPPHRDIQKTALGAQQTVSWKYFEKIPLEKLNNSGYKIVAVEQTEQSMALNKISFSQNEKLAVIFGNEVGGISQEIVDVADVCIEIPQLGTKHSLNISVCAGIVLWDLFLKLKSPDENQKFRY